MPPPTANPLDALIDSFPGLKESLESLRVPLTSLSGAFAKLDGLTTLSAIALGGVANASSGLVSRALTPLTGATTSLFNTINQLSSAFSGAIQGLVASVQGPLSAALTGMSNALGVASGAMAGPLTEAAGQIGQVTAGLSGVVSGLSGFRDAITSLPAAMAPFVAALAPGLMLQFNYAMRTLDATIGTALAPAFQVLVGLIHNVAGQLLPVMLQLAPILAQLAQVVASVVVPVVVTMAAVLTALMPLFQLLADVASAMVPVFDAMAVVVQALIKTIGDWIAGLFGGNVKGAMDNFRHAMEQLAGQMILLTARLALLFGDLKGAGGLFDNLQAAVDKQVKEAGEPPKGAAPAPTNVSQMGLEGIARQISSLSFVAGGGPAPEPPDVTWLKDISGQLKNLKQDSLKTTLEEWWKWVLEQVPKGQDFGEAWDEFWFELGAGLGGKKTRKFT